MSFNREPEAEPIPGYKLIDRIGGGGFGEVWKAEAPGGLLKAIKIVYGDLQASDEEGTRRARPCSPAPRPRSMAWSRGSKQTASSRVGSFTAAG